MRAMTTVGELFALEKRADEEMLSPEDRQALREREAAPVLDELDKLFAGWRDRYSESGRMGKACKYVENQVVALRVFLGDGRVPIHSNACEVSIRPLAVGRRNWLFAGSVRGGHAAATIYTLIESCKMAEVDPSPTWRMCWCESRSTRRHAWKNSCQRTGRRSAVPCFVRAPDS